MQSTPLGSNGMMENPGRQPSQSRIIGDLKGGEEELFLKMGDCFSLMSVEGDGYLYSEGFIDRGCKLQTVRKRRTVPPNFTGMCEWLIIYFIYLFAFSIRFAFHTFFKASHLTKQTKWLLKTILPLSYFLSSFTSFLSFALMSFMFFFSYFLFI